MMIFSKLHNYKFIIIPASLVISFCSAQFYFIVFSLVLRYTEFIKHNSIHIILIYHLFCTMHALFLLIHLTMFKGYSLLLILDYSRITSLTCWMSKFKHGLAMCCTISLAPINVF